MQRHRFDILSFVAGLVFAASGVAYLVNDGRWRFDAGPWVWPIVLLAGGAVILFSTLLDERSARTASVAPENSGIDGSLSPSVEIDEIEPGDDGF